MIFKRLGAETAFEAALNARGASAFGWMSLVLAAIGLLLLVIRAVAGPEREMVLELSTGRIHVDCYIAGDHIVRDYTADDVQAITLQRCEITLMLPKGPLIVRPSPPAASCKAIVVVVASELWGPQAVIMPDVPLTRLSGDKFELVAVRDPNLTTNLSNVTRLS